MISNGEAGLTLMAAGAIAVAAMATAPAMLALVMMWTRNLSSLAHPRAGRLWRVGERGEGEPAENGRARLRQVGGVAHK